MPEVHEVRDAKGNLLGYTSDGRTMRPVGPKEQLTLSEGWPKYLARGAMKLAPGVALQGGGASAGFAGGTAAAPFLGPLAPVSPFVGAVLGAGLGGAASEYLPESLGGSKEPSPGLGFTFGALTETPIGAFSLATRPLIQAGEEAATKVGERAAFRASREATRLATKQQTAESASKAARKELADVARERIGSRETMRQLRSRLPFTSGYDPTGRGAEDAASTFQGIATRIRNRVGKQLGDAYDQLKLPEKLAIDTSSLPETVNQISSSLEAPLGPSATDLLSVAKKLGAPETETSPILTAEGKPITRQIGGTASGTEVLRLRQRISKQLASTGGSDRYALSQLRESLDQLLEPHLPAEIKALRAQYRGLMRVLPYEAGRATERAINPSEVARVTFASPERALAIIRNAGADDIPTLKEGFAQHILEQVDPTADFAKQATQARKALQPWFEAGVPSELFGSQAGRELLEIANAPANAVKLSGVLRDPAARAEAFNEFQKLMDSPEGRGLAENVKKASGRLRELRQADPSALAQQRLLPSSRITPQEAATKAIRERLEGGSHIGRYIEDRALFDLALGGAFYGAYEREALPMVPLGIYGLWRLGVAAGAAKPLAKFLASDSARASGRNLFHLLAAIGGQTGRITYEEGE